MENYWGILDSSQKPHTKRGLADCKRVAIEPASAEQIPRPAGLLKMREEGSVALVPSAGPVRSKQVLGKLFGAVFRRGIEQRKFDVGKFFTLKFSGAYRATCPVMSGPNDLEQLQLLVRHALLARFKWLDRNNFPALHLRPVLKRHPISVTFSTKVRSVKRWPTRSMPVISTGIFTGRRSSLRLWSKTATCSAAWFSCNKFVWLTATQ
jgi:hypothetical protein